MQQASISHVDKCLVPCLDIGSLTVLNKNTHTAHHVQMKYSLCSPYFNTIRHVTASTGHQPPLLVRRWLCTRGAHVNATLHVCMCVCVCVHEELVIFRSIQCVFHPQLPDHCSVFRLFFSPALLYPVFCINCLLPRCLCDEQNVSVAEPMEGEPPQ